MFTKSDMCGRRDQVFTCFNNVSRELQNFRGMIPNVYDTVLNHCHVQNLMFPRFCVCESFLRLYAIKSTVRALPFSVRRISGDFEISNMMFLVNMFSPTRANFQNVFTVMITTSKQRTRAGEGIAAIFLINNHYCQWKNDLRPPHHTHTHI